MPRTGCLLYTSDGINDSLVEKNPLDDLEEDTEVNLGFDKALLYKNMVAEEADWLYNLEEWNAIFDEETRKAVSYTHLDVYKRQGYKQKAGELECGLLSVYCVFDGQGTGDLACGDQLL